MAHTHELFYRSTNPDGTSALTRFAAHGFTESEAREDLIELCEGVARSKVLTKERNGVVYKVDGQTEFFVSRDFFISNTFQSQDTHHGKSSGSRQQRRN